MGGLILGPIGRLFYSLGACSDCVCVCPPTTSPVATNHSLEHNILSFPVAYSTSSFIKWQTLPPYFFTVSSSSVFAQLSKHRSF